MSGVSKLPYASLVVGLVVSGTSVMASDAVGEALAVPIALSGGGAMLVVKTVQSTARGTVYLLERASDGATFSVELVGKGVGKASLAAGTVVTSSAIGAGVVLSAAGEAIAFIPNAVGRALLHSEQITQ